MDAKAIKKLTMKRGVHKAAITRFQTFIYETYDPMKHSIFDLETRLNLLLENWNKYNEVQITLQTSDESMDHSEDMICVEEEYIKTRSAFEGILQTRKKCSVKKEDDGNQTVTITNTNLPIINLPMFHGDYAKWLHFRDMFNSLIHQNQTLTDIQRLHYLNSSLGGEAKELIMNVPITSDNFTVAWKLIYERYNNPKLIVLRHITNLLTLPSASKESITNLRALINHVKGNINAIGALDNIKVPLHELLLIQMMLRNVDNSTRKAWKQGVSGASLSTLSNFFEFLEQRCQDLETSRVCDGAYSSQNVRIDNKYSRDSYLVTQRVCVACKESHQLYKCPVFMKSNVSQRESIVKKYNLCFNCLQANHISSRCGSKNTCRKCHLRHHTLLHRERNEGFNLNKSQRSNNQSYSNNQLESANKQDSSNSYCSFKGAHTQVLLATAIVLVRDRIGQVHECRALLDSGSQSHFVTEALVRKLHLDKHENSIPIQGINGVQAETNYCVTLNIQSRHTPYHRTISCSILPKISSNNPSSWIDTSDWDLPSSIVFADPTFNIPGKIDLLIGAELYFNLLLPCEQLLSPGHPTLLNTKLGWILSGSIPSRYSYPSKERKTFFIRNDELHQRLQRFWEVEEINKPIITKEMKYCEDHFQQNTVRNETGRYIVRLPVKDNVSQIGESKQGAIARFFRLEKRLIQDPELRKDYNQFLQEYEAMGHMELNTMTEACHSSAGTYYLPHHPVIKESSTTTKTRVVFDGSYKSSSGLSLNDVLCVGPTIQQDLCSIIIRFRTYQVAFTADIAKMYRQVRVHEEDCMLQQILWRPSPDELLKVYKLKTLTYGTSSASYLAIRCLNQLALDDGREYPEGAQVLLRDMYVDDCISGAATLEEALKIQKQLIELLHRGGFHLRKWCSNYSKVLQSVPEEDRETQLPLALGDEGTVKTLGLLWHPASDKFQILFNIKPKGSLTKRSVLSLIAAIFDPLGLISPVVILFKIFMQRLWQSGIQWDDELSNELTAEWETLFSQLSAIDMLRIERLVLSTDYANVQLHGFCDASESAYGACFYIRSMSSKNIMVKLLCAKSRVAPLKKISLPRLELCSAVVLSRLYKMVRYSLNINADHVYLWSDSMIVLSWIAASPTRWKTFVANRVVEIQETTSGVSWNHVTSQENPADLITRGIYPSEIERNQLWWSGPDWLQNANIQFPVVPKLSSSSEVHEETSIVTLVVIEERWEILHKYSKLHKLKRVIAYTLRFIDNCLYKLSNNHSKLRNDQMLSAEELNRALNTIIRHIQHKHFASEICALKSGNPLPSKSKLLSLTPYLDKENMLRVGGRIQNSLLPYESKFQLILPSEHPVTGLIVRTEHERLLHANQQLLITSLRQRYHIFKIRQLCRSVISKCLKCFKARATLSQQLMGTLPSHRVQPARPFLNSGVDYAGPVYIKTGLPRSKTSVKAYIAIFVCLATKAIHIELVSDLTTQAFIAAFRRFSSRRGRCAHIYSDNGRNFIGANNILKDLGKFLRRNEEQQTLQSFAGTEDFTWHFIPPNSPHFGGLWEASVKSMKYHLHRCTESTRFTFEEMSTLLCQIEACLNSRPLIPLQDASNEFKFLTPSHFLIGSNILSLPDSNYENTSVSRLKRWQHLQKIMQCVWRQWSRDYLHSIQQRTKWKAKQPNLEPNTLVLLKEDSTPMQWKTAVVQEVHPGPDGLVRVVTLRSPTGLIKRPIHKLSPFPEQCPN